MTQPVAALTGGTGFFGRYIAQALAAAGWRVRLLTRSAPIHPQLAAIPLELVLGDLGDRIALSRLVSGARVVIHAAGLVKARSEACFFTVNRDGARNLAESVARQAEPPRFIMISSLAARAPALSAYAASKRTGEEAIAGTLGSLSWVVLRPCVIYGPWDEEGLTMLHLAQHWAAPAITAPEPRIGMIHARDAAAAVVALCNDELSHASFEISEARLDGYGWRELLQRIGAALGRVPHAIPVPDIVVRLAGAASDGIAALSGQAGIFGRGKAREILHRDWSIDPARQLPGHLWLPSIDLDSGMRETVASWRGLGP